jgi:hypothetical protein
VKLIGHLEADNERILVTEFVSNGNLRQQLDGTFFVKIPISLQNDCSSLPSSDFAPELICT